MSRRKIFAHDNERNVLLDFHGKIFFIFHFFGRKNGTTDSLRDEGNYTTENLSKTCLTFTLTRFFCLENLCDAAFFFCKLNISSLFATVFKNTWKFSMRMKKAWLLDAYWGKERLVWMKRDQAKALSIHNSAIQAFLRLHQANRAQLATN